MENRYIHFGIVLGLIAAISAGLLGGVNDFTINDAGEVVGYVASVTEAGYGGDINFVVGIDKDAKVTGLNVVTSSETPGLGAKINEKEWQEHWIGKDSTYEFNKSVDAFAGATISPKAVYTGVIKALNTYQNEVSK